MTPKTAKNRHNAALAQEEGVRKGVIWVAVGVAAICVAGLLWRSHSKSGGQPEPVTQAETAPAPDNAPKSQPQPVAQAARSNQAPPVGAGAEAAPAKSATAVPPPTRPAPASVAMPVTLDPTVGALVTGLKQLSGTNAVLTAETVGAWRTNFTALVQAGSSAIPALRAFLDQKVDYPFNREVWQQTGYSSARLAALDALRQIGGPDAIGAMESMLATTQTPKEIAVLARDLEEASPGQYRQQALEAARAGLAAALASKDPTVDVAPLFEVFQHYGDASSISELERAMGQWKYYATIALANLPDNAGVPAILRLADPASGSGDRVVPLQMVAQLAASNPDARQFLAAQVANKSIPPNLWPYLTGPLSGDQYYPVDSAITPYPQLQSWSDLKTTHLSYGNQNLYTLPGEQNLTAEGINQRLALVDELLRSAPDPAAQQALQRARDTLARRSTRAVAQTPGSGTGQ